MASLKSSKIASRLNPNLYQIGPRLPTKEFNGIAVVGDFPRVEEARKGSIWGCYDGKLLMDLMKVAGIDPDASLFVNLFEERAPHDTIKSFYDRKKQVKPEWADDLKACETVLRQFAPRLIVTLGPHAMLHFLGSDSIQSHRGTVHMCALHGFEDVKVIPTYHPESIRKQFKFRATTGKDFIKANIESRTKGLVYPEREIWIRPTIQDLYNYEAQFMQEVDLLTVDIETDYPRSRLITCIGFSPSAHSSIVVPFFDTSKPNWLYWRNVEDHKRAHLWCKKWIESNVPKLGQNILFDIQYLAAEFGCKMQGHIEDTMLLSHALQPELERSLAYLASTCTNEQSFKTLVKFKKEGPKITTNKEGQ